jgi:hypothetical protein
VNALMEFGYKASVGLVLTLYLFGLLASALRMAAQFPSAVTRIRFEPKNRIGEN